MTSSAAACTTVVAVLLAGATFAQAQTKDYHIRSVDLLRLLAEKPWLLHSRWEPRDQDEGYRNKIDNDEKNYYDEFRSSAEKRSAVATALNGRRRRQPTPSLGKAVTPYVGVVQSQIIEHLAGVLNDVGSFFDSLRDNLETLASLSPEQRSTLFQEPPTVIHAPSPGGAGAGGGGMRRLHALRPLRPTGNIRSYNRRSDLEAYGSYPGANHHDPGLLWTGLGR